jgi:RNA polymerase sigma factor (sigma-70 family)
MSFPQTQHTLIHRIVASNSDRDWAAFFEDYWTPICRFAMRKGCSTLDEAEDVAAQTFEIVWKNNLLARWVASRSAKLRTVLCSVVRKVIANLIRVRQARENAALRGREKLDDRGGLPVITSLDASAEEIDAFYGAWVEEILQRAVDSLMDEFHREGKGDYFRVLYGRLCDGMTMREVARSLSLTPTQVENYARQAQKRLSKQLERLVRGHVERYGQEGDIEQEFKAEWGRLEEHLSRHGGMDEAVRAAYQSQITTEHAARLRGSMHDALYRLSGAHAKKN